MAVSPKEIRAADGKVAILWSDGHAGQYRARELRLACKCAACVDEWTNEKLVRDDLVPAQLKPAGIEVVGNYALHFTWSDGHSTGIFTYDYLRQICACDPCREARSFHV